MVLFASDNVDFNTCTIDGKNTFHGLGLMAAVTSKVSSRTCSKNQLEKRPSIPRVSKEFDLTKATIDIRDYLLVKKIRRSIYFPELDIPNGQRMDADLLWELSCKF